MNRAPSTDGVRSRFERSGPNSTPLPAEIAGPLQKLAAAKTMPSAQMTPAQEHARRQDLYRQVVPRPAPPHEPYRPSTGEAWDAKERAARAKAAKTLEDDGHEHAARGTALGQEIP